MFDIQVRFLVSGRPVALEGFVEALATQVATAVRGEAQAWTSPGLERGHKQKPLAVGINEAAKMLGISPWTLRLYVGQGKIRAVRIGSRVLVPMEVLERVAVEGVG